MELTPDLILNGAKSTKKIYVSAYKAELEVKPIKAGVFEELVRKHKISGTTTDASGSYKFLIDICKNGIVEPTIAKLVDEMDYTAISEIGSSILGFSQVTEEQIENFSPRP